ncbi:hypothetical protein BRD19_10700 [Halobacteriales archaeon SW_7_65_23]|nr:MAG: hypothetical protein BRD19_10700 [Halobacteriales archaeon SW_7_65_23]
MEFNLPVSVGILGAIIVAGVGGLAASGVMSTETVLMMVAPSMIVFAAIVFAIGVMHGQYRATTQ